MGYLDKLKPVGTSTQSNMPATLSYKDKLQPVSHETVTREKTGLAKTAGAFNTVFGGGKIGEYIGTKAAYAFASPEERKYIDQTTPSSGEIIGSALQSAALFTPFGKIAQGLGVGAKQSALVPKSPLE